MLEEKEIDKIGQEGRSVCHPSGSYFRSPSTSFGEKHVELFFVLYVARVVFYQCSPYFPQRRNTMQGSNFRIASLARQVELAFVFFGLPNTIDNPSPLIVIEANFFTHPPLPEVWPTARTFWDLKTCIFTPHIA